MNTKTHQHMPDHAVGEAQQNVEVRPINVLPTLPLDNWISKDCIDMNKSNIKKNAYIRFHSKRPHIIENMKNNITWKRRSVRLYTSSCL